VTIISANEKDYADTRVIETDTLLSAVRIAHTFKPKRGYKVKKVIIEEVDVIV
jgi:hypothetical protein